MKKALIIVFIVAFALALLCVTGVFLFRHFVTDQITDRGGMENPDAESEEQPLDGDYTYVANEILLNRIAGVWKSTDGRWEMTLGEDYGIVIAADGETVQETTLDFSYLPSGDDRETELRLQSDDSTLRLSDGSTAAELLSLCHVPTDGDAHGTIRMELTDGRRIEFRQHGEQ